MQRLLVTDRSGEQHDIAAAENSSVMEVIRGSGMDDLLALCGGVCSCATCHVYVDAQSAALFSPMTSDENDLLDSSDHRTKLSRLSCQLTLGKTDQVIEITIAPED